MTQSSIDDAGAAERANICQRLAAGLETDWQHRAYEDADIKKVTAALHALDSDDIEGRLRIAGFTLTPYVAEEDPEIEQACATCMYFEFHRRYCNLPELKLYVEAEWSCNLWRI